MSKLIEEDKVKALLAIFSQLKDSLTICVGSMVGTLFQSMNKGIYPDIQEIL